MKFFRIRREKSSVAVAWADFSVMETKMRAVLDETFMVTDSCKANLSYTG